MEFNTDLRPLFSYNYKIIIVFITVLITIIVLKFIYYKLIHGHIFKKMIKEKYLTKLIKLEKNIYNKKISTRDTYIILSALIRDFIYEMTNIKVQNYTLSEIEKIDIPHLKDLIREYYKSEFQENSSGDIEGSLSRVKKVIKEW